MKVLLITLPKEGSVIQWAIPKYFMPDTSKYIPLGLLSLASNIPKKHDVRILDPSSENWSIDKTIEEIEKEAPDILGISAITFKAYQMKEILKKTSARYKIVGGPHTTYNAKYVLEQGADAVFRGQLADLEFAKAVDEQPKGIFDCHTNINQIRFPDRGFVDVSLYYKEGNLFASEKRMSMFSGVGCPHRCTFCDVQAKKIQRKNPEFVLDEMIYLQLLGAECIHNYEDNFNTDEKYLKKLCAEIDRRGFNLKWSAKGQVRISLEISKSLAERGFKRIHAGLESLSNDTLRFFRKPQNYNQIERFCNTMGKANIDIVGFFIIGAPTETKEDRKTMALKIKNLGIKYPLFNLLQPLPNTEYYVDLLRQGVYKKDYWAEYIANPSKDFMLPFTYGEKKWQEDANFVQTMREEFKE